MPFISNVGIIADNLFGSNFDFENQNLTVY